MTLLASDLCPRRHPVLIERSCLRMQPHDSGPCTDGSATWWCDDLHDIGECQEKITNQGYEIDALIQDGAELRETIESLEIQIADLSRQNNTLRRRLGDK